MSDEVLIQPLAMVAVGLGNLRFFKAPLEGPQQPWHSVDDLHRCLALPRDLRRLFIKSLHRDYPDDCKRIITSEGPTTIAPHWMAQGLIGSMDESKRLPVEGFEFEYTKAAAHAMDVLTKDMTDMDGMRYAIAAFMNSNKVEGSDD